MRFEDVTVSSRSGPRRALIATPTQHFVVGRARLAQLRVSIEPGPIDLEIRRQVQARAKKLQILVMRGRDDAGEGSWTLGPDLDDDEAEETFALLHRSQLPTYRRFLAAGVFMFVHAEFGARETHFFRRSADRVLAELQTKADSTRFDEGERAVARLDAWSLRHLTFFFSLGIDKALGEVIPDNLAAFEARTPHIEQMLATLPPEAIA
ncbi:MAG: hypothetical protein NVS3B10_08320 [Polyangiales bacterium]